MEQISYLHKIMRPVLNIVMVDYKWLLL